MNIKIDFNLEKPAYIQLYEGLVKCIVDGVYPYGSKLPSKRIIAADTETSVITVEHAITLLNEEGYTKSKERSGVFVIFKDEDFISNQTKRKETTKIIKIINPIISIRVYTQRVYDKKRFVFCAKFLVW